MHFMGYRKMSLQASNAFLKILEELPKNTYFLLIAENQDEILHNSITLPNCQFRPIESSALRM